MTEIYVNCGSLNAPCSTSKAEIITQAVRHQVLKWALFSILFWEGLTFGLMLIGWRATNNQHHLANMIWHRSSSQPDKCNRKSNLKTFTRAQSNVVPLKELSRVKLRWWTGEQIKSSKIHDYTRRAHVLRDICNAFHERTSKHESKRKSYESSERWFNNRSLRLKDLRAKGVPEVIGDQVYSEIAIIE